MIVIDIPGSVAFILDKLEKAGYEAYIVGGCVRDAILGKSPSDWDITTSALPSQVKEIFHKTIDTGLQHGTVTVMMKGEGYEVTTYRIDGEYEDGRHPKEVSYTLSLDEDLKRRDFTINAMAYNPRTGLVDRFDGQKDLENGIIRCVGDPDERFSEDALRIMRAVRFSGQLGFKIDKKTFEAIENHYEDLRKVSWERIRVELIKLIVSAHADRLYALSDSKILGVILPEMVPCVGCDHDNDHHIYDVYEHIVHSVQNMNYFFGNNDFESYTEEQTMGFDEEKKRLYKKYLKEAAKIAKEVIDKADDKDHTILSTTMFLHDIEKPSCKSFDGKKVHFFGHPEAGAQTADKILRRLTYDNDSIDTIRKLIRWHDYRDYRKEIKVRHLIHKVGKEDILKLFVVQFADVLAQNPDKFDDKFEKLFYTFELTKKVLNSDAVFQIKDLEINGNDLIDMGFVRGPMIGAILNELLQKVLNEPELNRHDTLISIAKEHLT